MFVTYAINHTSFKNHLKHDMSNMTTFVGTKCSQHQQDKLQTVYGPSPHPT